MGGSTLVWEIYGEDIWGNSNYCTTDKRYWITHNDMEGVSLWSKEIGNFLGEFSTVEVAQQWIQNNQI